MPRKSEDLLRVRGVAERADVPARTVRFYADIGLLRPAARSAGGFRYFGPEAVERVQLLRRASRLGVGLDEIRRVLEVAERTDCHDAHQAFAQAIRERIRQVDGEMGRLAAARQQLIDLAAESDVGCSDAFCLCRTRPDGLVPLPLVPRGRPS